MPDGILIATGPTDFNHFPTFLYTGFYLPLVALLASETVQMINVGFGFHNHLESRNWFTTSSATSGRSEKSIEIFRNDFKRFFKPFVT